MPNALSFLYRLLCSSLFLCLKRNMKMIKIYNKELLKGEIFISLCVIITHIKYLHILVRNRRHKVKIRNY